MRLLLLTLASAMALGAPALAGQEATPHQGFWIGFGVGGGSDLSDGAAGAREGGAVYVRLGGTVSPMLLVGGEASAWARRENNTTLTRANVAGTVYLYPVRRGFFLKGGLGFSSVQVQSTSGPGTFTITDEGFGATLGGGYDVRIGRNLFVTPNLDFLFQVINDDTDVVALITVGLTWH